jgi:hypothetical protein
MLVAPETSDGGAVQNIWLPAGDTWYNFWTDARIAGNDAADLAYTTRTGELPLFVKAGAIVPMYPYAQSTAFFNKTQLEMDVYTGKDNSFTLYEDDGKTEAFHVNSANSTTLLTYTDSTRLMTIGQPVGTYAGAPTTRRYIVRLHGLTGPVGMRVNGGATLPAFTSEALALMNGGGEAWDASRKILSVVTPAIAVVTGGGAALTVDPSGAPFPAAAGGSVYEAESASLSGAVIGTSNRDYTGTGYADYVNASGDFVEWTVNVATAGTHSLAFRYANGGTTNRPLSVSVNGTVVNSAVPFGTTSSWTSWGTTNLTVNLPAGAVKIRATATGSSGPDLDNVTVN